MNLKEEGRVQDQSEFGGCGRRGKEFENGVNSG